jgi:uncharacterized BrkB/YihY/UPF0761 family membrane protein
VSCRASRRLRRRRSAL